MFSSKYPVCYWEILHHRGWSTGNVQKKESVQKLNYYLTPHHYMPHN